MDKVLSYLGERIIESPFTVPIGRRFEDILSLILMENVNYEATKDEEFFRRHRRKSVALAKLVEFSAHAQRFALTYFAQMPSPFDVGSSTAVTTKRRTVNATVATCHDDPTKFDILKCCHTFLKFDRTFFMHQWKWSEFIEKFGASLADQNDEYKFIYNHIMAMLTGMSPTQLQQLNHNISIDVEINFAQKTEQTEMIDAVNSIDSDKNNLKWNLKSERFANIEGVLLPIFDAKNVSHSEKSQRIVMVESARSNLKGIAIGVAAGRAICLSGPVGSGKTTLIEYLAYRTGRIPPKQFDSNDTKPKESAVAMAGDKRKGGKRKAAEMEQRATNEAEFKTTTRNGFLRIQLGDQTDSKMLLGQYHCTDVPGEFVWQPGVLTLAVMNGYWLLLEDLDQCSRDVCVMLTNFFENNYLYVPGFRDCIQISSGFQLFVTRRYVMQMFPPNCLAYLLSG